MLQICKNLGFIYNGVVAFFGHYAMERQEEAKQITLQLSKNDERLDIL